jgi:hypothetical protein
VEYVVERLAGTDRRSGRQIEPCDDARDLSREGRDRILECRPLILRRSNLRPGEDKALWILVHVKRLNVLVSGPLSGRVTLNSRTSVGMTSSPSGNGALASLFSIKNFPCAPEKSRITSNRSAGPMVRSGSGTGAGKNPPSVPIWTSTSPGQPSGSPLGVLSLSVR